MTVMAVLIVVMVTRIPAAARPPPGFDQALDLFICVICWFM